MRVLLVEDDVRIAEFLSRGLIERGYTVDHVCSAEDALDLVSEGSTMPWSWTSCCRAWTGSSSSSSAADGA